MANLLIIGAIVVGVFILLRLFSGRSSSFRTRHDAEVGARSTMARVQSYENNINSMQRIVRTSPNERQREVAARRLERMLKEKERLKKKAERLTRRS